MAKERAPSSRERIEELAADWLVRRDRGDFSDADEQELDAWLAESPHHAVAYHRLEAVWTVANRLKVLGAGTSPAALAPSVNLHRYWAAAASVLLSLGLYALISSALHAYGYSTPVGGVATLPMADGSRITLNTNSAVRISISKAERRVELLRGEAFFDVAKDINRPFIVSAGERRVTAVGTQFSVRREGAATKVVVTEGRVRLDTTSGGPSAQISAGQMAETRGGKVLFQDDPAAKADDALKWRSGFVIFHRTSMTDAATELNRYAVHQTRMPEPSAASTVLCGTIRTDNIDGFTRLMRDASLLESRKGPVRNEDVPLERPISVPSGDLSSALENLVQQSGIQLLYECNLPRDIKTSGVRGNLSAQQAVAKLIQGTPLKLRTDATGAMLLAAPKHLGAARRT
jgi:transmembrane sensor